MLDMNLTSDNCGVIDDFQAFLEGRSIKLEQDITPKDIRDYILAKRKQNKDMKHIIDVIVEYFVAAKNDVLSHEAWLYRDAIGHIKKISQLTKDELGDSAWMQVFGGMEMPETGWTLDEIANFTRQMYEKMVNVASKEQIEGMIQKHAHGYKQTFDDTLNIILETKGIDGMIEHMNESLRQELIKCRDKGVFCGGTMVDDSVIDYYEKHPSTTRIGNKIIFKQGPSLAQKFLHETDEKMRRYYACHCGVKKQSILQSEGSLSHSLCYCCLGHCIKVFEAAFGKKLNGKVVRTVMDEGCFECVFELDIPSEWSNK